ncbi:MAG: hypothetical protein RJQ21_03660 [Rhodospirillales bacterium]
MLAEAQAIKSRTRTFALNYGSGPGNDCPVLLGSGDAGQDPVPIHADYFCHSLPEIGFSTRESLFASQVPERLDVKAGRTRSFLFLTRQTDPPVSIKSNVSPIVANASPRIHWPVRLRFLL